MNWLKNITGWNSVGTIFKARMEMLGGVLLAGLSALSAYSFLPYITGSSTDWKVIGGIAAYVFVMGMVSEIVRRANATDV